MLGMPTRDWQFELVGLQASRLSCESYTPFSLVPKPLDNLNESRRNPFSRAVPMNAPEQLIQAQFTPKVCTYWLISGAIGLACTLIGIPFLLLWFPIGLLVTKRYLASMECVLTENSLKVKKGIFVRVEKTIPLEKITDMGMVQGPIMRSFDLHTLTVETAGQSGTGALVSLTGIEDAPGFREAVLEQRDAINKSSKQSLMESSAAPSSDSDALLHDIKDVLLRIETLLAQQTNR